MRRAAAAVMPDVVEVTADALVGGSSALVVALSLVSPGGERRRVVFRQHPDGPLKAHTHLVASKEFHLTRQLAAEGLEVARPLALHDGDPSHGPWLVTEWIRGTTEVPEADVDAALFQMADYLARLHQLGPDQLAAPGIAEIEDPIEALPRYLPDDELGQSIRRALGTGVRRRPNPSVLLHGDFWPGNVMFERGRLVAVLDWEDAAWGDSLVDLACARVELTCAFGAEASAKFTSLYLGLRQQLDEHDLALWDVYVSVTALSSMHLWGLSHEDESERRRTTRQFLRTATDRLLRS